MFENKKISFLYKDISKIRTGGAVVAGIKFRDALIKKDLSLTLLSYTFGNSNFFKVFKDIILNSKAKVFALLGAGDIGLEVNKIL